MKMITLSVLIVVTICVSTISFAQNFEHKNPYAIFGKTYVLGEKGENGKSATSKVTDAVFVIENTAADSPIARLEHNTRTGIVMFFDRAGKVIGETQLTDAERAWLTPDPKAEKYYPFSPYAYCLNNPLRFIDPYGEDVYMLFYTTDDKMFRAAAETRMQEIQSNKNFNTKTDKVIMIGVSDIGLIGDMVNWAVSSYSDQYGKTAEAGIWSHAGWDGPIGDVTSSGEYGMGGQMSLEGWSNINFNWKNSDANMGFYGCNTGNDTYGGKYIGSFARNISNLDNFNGVNVWGQQTSSYPSNNPFYRSTNMARTLGYGYGIGNTYMVGGNPGQGVQSHWFLPGSYPPANPMNVYQNGRKIRSAFQNR